MKYDVLCTRCILPDTTPYISFDDNGVCNYCRTYKPMNVKGEEALTRVLDMHSSPSKKYDCMVGISGGRDSTYTLWKLVHDYNKRVLAFNDRSYFTSEQAHENVKNAVRILNVDFINGKFPVEKQKKATQRAIKVWAHHPSSAMIPIICSECKCVLPRILQTARDNHISLVAFGSNPLETASFKEKGMGGARDYGNISNIPNIVKKSLKELKANPQYLTGFSLSTIFKMYLMAGHNTPYIKWRFKDVRVMRLFDYLRWNEKEVEETITKNLGWKTSSEVTSSWRFDCRLDYVKRLLYVSTIGVTELQDLLSKMIREGMITRDEALVRFQQDSIVPKHVVSDVLSGMELTLADLSVEIDQDFLA